MNIIWKYVDEQQMNIDEQQMNLAERKWPKDDMKQKTNEHQGNYMYIDVQ